jgi:hypothetical protein
MLHLFGVVLLFAVLGPVVGGIVVIAGLGIWIGYPSPGDALAVMLTMMIYGLFVSYWMGAIPALLAGAVIGFMDAFRGGTTLAFAAALGAAMGIGWTVMMGGGTEAEQVVLHVLVVLASAVATIVCWLATRWRARA